MERIQMGTYYVYLADAVDKRIADLERELSELRKAVREMLPIWQEVVIDGGCDHSVGVCACDVIAMADTLAALLPERKDGA